MEFEDLAGEIVKQRSNLDVPILMYFTRVYFDGAARREHLRMLLHSSSNSDRSWSRGAA